MRQANNFIHNVEPPYAMESVLRVKNCMYALYTLLTEKKIPQYRISVTAVCIVLIVLLILSAIYIFVKKRYWFW